MLPTVYIQRTKGSLICKLQLINNSFIVWNYYAKIEQKDIGVFYQALFTHERVAVL